MDLNLRRTDRWQPVATLADAVADRAMQAPGQAGVTDEFGRGSMWPYARALRIVDGPDAVRRHQLGRQEFAGSRSPRHHG